MTAVERIEESFDLLTYTKGVLGVVVCTLEGIPIRDSFLDIDRSQAIRYAAFASDMMLASAPFEKIKDEGAVQCIRVRTSISEIIMRTDGEIVLLCATVTAVLGDVDQPVSTGPKTTISLSSDVATGIFVGVFLIGMLGFAVSMLSGIQTNDRLGTKRE